jgi:hypothetical protein
MSDLGLVSFDPSNQMMIFSMIILRSLRNITIVFVVNRVSNFVFSSTVEKRSTPSCSVLIKYLPETNDVVFGHNSWFEYRAMGYR